MNTLSLVMIVKDEEAVIARCLESVKNIVDEIVIVDTGSTDATIEIAKKYGANLFETLWDDHFSNARNFALAKSKCDWNLVLDADEYIMNDCKYEIREFINTSPSIGRIRRFDKFVLNNEIRHSQAFISRVFPKNTKYIGRIHEQVNSTLPRQIVNVDVYHDGYYLKKKSDRNIKLLLLEEKHNPDESYILFQLAKEYKISQNHFEADRYFSKCYSYISNNDSYKPQLIVEYIYNLIALKKFKIGLEIIDKEYNYLIKFSDFHFVVALFYMELAFSDFQKYGSYFSRIESEYLACIQIGDLTQYDSTIGTGSFLALYNLGVYYETTGNTEKAKECYLKAANYEYVAAINRLKNL